MQLNRVQFYAGSMHYQIKVKMVKAFETISQNSDASEGEGNKGLKHNPLRTRAFPGFNGHKRCARLTLSILQSFFHFPKSKDTNIRLK